ncbi:MAG: TonB-dependent receptor [Bacteroidales bacterium]|nr:TonB-dependent receptor [Bacteroidales bacterium]
MSKIFKTLAVIVGLGFGVSLSAQTITGVVKDSGGEPVIGASVVEQGTMNGIATGIDGDYSIKVADAEKAVLEISMIGYKTVVINVAGRSVIDVVLEDDNTMLEETVVVGYATVKRRDLLGSVSSINSEKLTEQPVSNVSQALSGKMAGVSVTTTEGDPDADIKIRVRGGGSITQDNSPLYIVDGFPVESISDISSSEIASIDVLKDAFSTAIYGSRGANGVVIVTTKGAEKGRKVSVKLNAYGGFKKMANAGAIKPMDSENYVKFQYELAKVRDNVSSNYEPYFGTFGDMDLYTGLATNDWVGMVFGNTGSNSNADIAISGSSDNANWSLSYAHTGDKAIMKSSTYSRDNLSFKSMFKTSDNTNIDLNVRYSKTNVLGAGANSMNDTGTTSGNGRLKHAVCYAPFPVASTLQNIDEEADYGDNAPPLKSVADNDSKRVRTTWTANAAFNWTIIDGLVFKIDGGLEAYRQTDNRFYGLTTYYAGNTSSYRNTPSNQYKDLTRDKYRNTNTLNYNFENVFANSDHSLTLLIGEEMTITKSNLLTAMVENFPTFYDSKMAWNFMSSGTPVSTSNFINPDDNLLSFFGRVNYDYRHRFSLGATFRADGSSKFAKGNQWGYFPSAAASWTLSNMPWMESATSWIDQLKLRYSFGTAGNNNIPSGQLTRQFSATSQSTWIDGTISYWTAGKIMSNPDLKWETTYTHNVGLDFSFFKGKVSGSIEAYQNDTRDLLILFPIAGTGYDSQYKNIGSTRNRGAELSLTMPLIQTKDYSLSISGNIAYNKNTITDLGGLEAITGSSVQSYWASTEIGDDYLVQVGQSLGNMYGYICDGRYSASDFDYMDGKWKLKEGVADDSAIIGAQYLMPGALKLKADSDGVIRKHVIGNASPDFSGGFAINGYVKGFDISANFTYMIGNDVYNANKVEFTSSRKFYNRNLVEEMNVNNRWTNIDWTTGELVTDPARLDQMNAGTTMWSPCIGNAVFTDWAVEDGSFLRMQSATLGYTIPETLTEKISIRKIRVYVTGTNLFCLTKYTGYDPEVDTRRSTPLTPGVDYSAYPKSIGFVAGFNITF